MATTTKSKKSKSKKSKSKKGQAGSSTARIYAEVTDRIVALLEKGVAPWRKTFRQHGVLPSSGETGKEYRGINLLLLAFSPYASPYWVTYKGAQRMGGNVRKGERSAFCVVKWLSFEKVDADTGKKKSIPYLKKYAMFSVEQCDGLEGKVPVVENEKRDDAGRIEAADRIVADYIENDGPELITGDGLAACYWPADDKVQVPSVETCDSDADHYAVLFHELAHSTGHADRLDRHEMNGKHRFGSEDYSKEELVAELAASMISGALGFGDQTIENSAAYLASWIKALKADPKMVVWAASRSQKAADLIIGENLATD